MKQHLFLFAFILFASAAFAQRGNRVEQLQAKQKETAPSTAVTEAAAKSIEFQVSGMFCESCPARVEALLKKNEGVKTAKVTYADKKAVITYDPALANPTNIKESLNGSAYSLALPAAPEGKSTK